MFHLWLSTMKKKKTEGWKITAFLDYVLFFLQDLMVKLIFFHLCSRFLTINLLSGAFEFLNVRLCVVPPRNTLTDTQAQAATLRKAHGPLPIAVNKCTIY